MAMDANLKQIFDSFSFAIKNYTSSLGPDNNKIKESKKLLEKLSQKANDSVDTMAIYVDPSFGKLGVLLGELASETPLSAEELAKYGIGTEDFEIPPANVAAAGYHIAFDNLSDEIKGTLKPYYDIIFEIEQKAENVVFFNSMLAESGVLLRMSLEPLIKTTKNALEQSAQIFSPTVNHQHQLAIETYGKVKSVAEMEFEGLKMTEMANTEHEWDALYIEVLDLLPACARTIETFGALESSIRKLRGSYKLMSEFMGMEWEDIFTDERYLFFWNNFLWNNYPQEKKTRNNLNSPKEYHIWLKKNFFEPYIKDESKHDKNPDQKVHFWGKDEHIHESMKLLCNPPRPMIIKETD
jgi:hypothetical protein